MTFRGSVQQESGTDTKQVHLVSRKVDEHTDLRDKGGWEDVWGAIRWSRDSKHPMGYKSYRNTKRVRKNSFNGPEGRPTLKNEGKHGRRRVWVRLWIPMNFCGSVQLGKLKRH